MRDDLHHSIPQTHRWRRVVQSACAPGLGRDLVDEVARAVWEPAAELLHRTDWGRTFIEVLENSHSDLFGTEGIEARLSGFENTCQTPLARLFVEVAFAEVQAGRLGFGMKTQVIRATLELAAQNNIEGAVSWVADQHKDPQVRELRAALMGALPRCNFSAPPSPRGRKAKLTVEQGLGIELPLSV